jgi:phosphoserine aminotransferase
MFRGTVEPADRSLMNACFVMSKGNESKEQAFLDFVAKRNMIGLQGHRSVGGFRASMYNALPLESVQELVDCMKLFEEEQA